MTNLIYNSNTFNKGDIVKVTYLFKTKNNKNIFFLGTVIDIKGDKLNKSIKIKRKINSFCVYFTFLLASPFIQIIKVN